MATGAASQPVSARQIASVLPLAGMAGALLGAAGFGVLAGLGWVTGLWQLNVLATLSVFMLAGIAYVSFEMLRRRPSREERQSLAQDIAAGEVDELALDVTAAKAARDPEHGTLSLFLRLADGRVFYDCFDDAPGPDGWEQAPSAIPEPSLPRRTLLLVYGTASGALRETRMTGDSFTPQKVGVLAGDPSRWPEAGTFLNTGWDKIESRWFEKQA